MASREKNAVLEALRKKYERVWSISRKGAGDGCLYEYYLSYCKGNKDKDGNRIIKSEPNVYGACGGAAHDIAEKFYRGELKYEELATEYAKEFLKITTIVENPIVGKNGLAFPLGDNEKNNYYRNMMHFFKNHNVLEYDKMDLEILVFANVLGYYFQGYIDVLYTTKDGKTIIMDWKTSTEFKGEEKIEKAGEQLLLYKLMLEEVYGLKVDGICWNMMKYCKLYYTNPKAKNPKEKSMKAERRNVTSMKLEKLQKYYPDDNFDREYILFDDTKENWEVFTHYDKFNFRTEDRIDYYEPSKEKVNKMLKSIKSCIENLMSLGELEMMYPPKPEEFYCTRLCGYKVNCKHRQDAGFTLNADYYGNIK
ncbi:MAG: PD-(D/E)XK nuclease family protein [Paraclostridium sp.]